MIEPDVLNAPDGASSRSSGVARLRVRDGADRCCDRRLTHDRCLEQALPANPPPEIAALLGNQRDEIVALRTQDSSLAQPFFTS